MPVLRSFLEAERAQVSIEFILITGGVILAAISIFSLQGTINAFANQSTRWVELERNATIMRITR